MTNKLDPLLIALIERIPPSGSLWSSEQRMLWLSACEMAFNLVYGPVDRVVVSIKDETPASEEKTDVQKLVDLAKTVVERESVPQKAPAPLADEPQKISAPFEKVPPKNQRPEGIPSSIQMATEAITELGPASAAQIRDWLRKNYWEKMPDSWTACLWNFVTDGRLSRSGINFVIAKSRDDVLAAPSGLPKPPAKPVKPTGGVKPITFEHNGAITDLSSPREYVIAGKLRAAMGKGHIAEAFLAESITGRNTDDNRKIILDVALGMNSKLLNVGLKIEHYPGFGLVMKDV
jgi:hypothetical protein